MVDSVVSAGGFGVQPADPAKKASSGSSPEGPGKASFEDVLRSSIQDVDKLQHDATEAIHKMSTGKADSVAEVMTAVEKADIAFRTLMQVRNKLVDAYEELLRIRI